MASHVALGNMCMRVPKRPGIPQGTKVDQLMALPDDKSTNGKKRTRKNTRVNWILFSHEQDMQ